MVRNTHSRTEVPASEAPWRRSSSIQYGPSARAWEAPSSGVVTRRLVSPNSSRLSPERHFFSERATEMKQGHELDASSAKRQHRGGVVMTDGIHVGSRLIDLAVDDHLAVEAHMGRHHRLRIQRHFENVGRLDQLARAVAGNEIAAGVLRVARTDVPECIDDAFVGKDAIGDGKLVPQ